MSAARDALTIVRSHGPLLAKRIYCTKAGGWRVRAYDNVRTVDLNEHPLSGLGQLEELLRRLARRPDCAVLRGAPADPARVRAVRRLLHADPATGDRATLTDCPRAWAALDFDHLACPLDCDRSDLVGCARLAVAALPAAFADATCLVQGTASHAIADGLRLRLWFWLARPLAGGELKRWLRGSPADAAIFNPAQLIYTAAPLFAGIPDPLPERIAVRFGASDAVIPPPCEALRPPPVFTPRPVAPGAVTGNLAGLAARVMRAAPGNRHPTLLRAARRAVELERDGMVEPAETDALLTAAARESGLDEAGRNAEREVAAILAWARHNASADNCNPGGQS